MISPPSRRAVAVALDGIIDSLVVRLPVVVLSVPEYVPVSSSAR